MIEKKEVVKIPGAKHRQHTVVSNKPIVLELPPIERSSQIVLQVQGSGSIFIPDINKTLFQGVHRLWAIPTGIDGVAESLYTWRLEQHEYN